MNLYCSSFEHIDKKNIDQFEVLRKLDTKSNYSQRKLASELGFSLGKLNYCMKALRKKGLVKINNFKNNPSKLNYVYILTPKGISKKVQLTMNFMKKKMQEYDELKAEIEKKSKINVDSYKDK